MLPLENLKEGETLKIAIRRHWIVYVFVALYALVWVIISASTFITFWLEFFTTMLNIVFWLFYSIFLYIEWLNHELDLYIVTNNRVIWVEQISWMNRNTRECNLWQVQEVSSKTKGIFANIFNYGTLSIQTAGANTNNLDMDFCPDSMQQARQVLNIVDEYRDNEARLKSGMTGEDIHKHNQIEEWKN
jgi:uncharacterized membrane protein YdbT with pleckstrin-like domain